MQVKLQTLVRSNIESNFATLVMEQLCYAMECKYVVFYKVSVVQKMQRTI